MQKKEDSMHSFTHLDSLTQEQDLMVSTSLMWMKVASHCHSIPKMDQYKNYTLKILNLSSGKKTKLVDLLSTKTLSTLPKEVLSQLHRTLNTLELLPHTLGNTEYLKILNRLPCMEHESILQIKTEE